MQNLIVKENLKGKKLTKVSAYFKRVGEKETMNGTYYFEDGTSEEGCSYNNNYLSGTINFSNDEDHIPIAEFLEGLKDENWASQVSRSIDNFEGEGSSIDYDEDEFESFEEEIVTDVTMMRILIRHQLVSISRIKKFNSI